MRKRSFTYFFLVLLFGAIIGTALGELIGFLLPESVVKQFFLRSANIGFEPFALNLGVFTCTLGFTMKLNIIGIIGFAMTAYMLRWYQSERQY